MLDTTDKIIILVFALYISPKFTGIFLEEFEASILGMKLKIRSKEKRPSDGSTSKERHSKKNTF